MVVYYWFMNQHILRVDVQIAFASPYGYMTGALNPSKGDSGAPTASSTQQVLTNSQSGKPDKQIKKVVEGGPAKARLEGGRQSIDRK